MKGSIMLWHLFTYEVYILYHALFYMVSVLVLIHLQAIHTDKWELILNIDVQKFLHCLTLML